MIALVASVPRASVVKQILAVCKCYFQKRKTIPWYTFSSVPEKQATKYCHWSFNYCEVSSMIL